MSHINPNELPDFEELMKSAVGAVETDPVKATALVLIAVAKKLDSIHEELYRLRLSR